jgi:hypothetical protein
VLWLAVLVVFTVGAAAGWLVVTARHACELLADDQRRTVALFTVLAETAERDGAKVSSAALRAYAQQAAAADRPRC